jgi:hypothetical protein
MLNATFSMVFIGAPVLFLGIVLAIRRSMQNRRENAAPFRGYFAAGNYRDLQQHSDLSETEDWRSDIHPRYTSFRLRNPEPNLNIDEPSRRGSRAVDRNRDSF